MVSDVHGTSLTVEVVERFLVLGLCQLQVTRGEQLIPLSLDGLSPRVVHSHSTVCFCEAAATHLLLLRVPPVEP